MIRLTLALFLTIILSACPPPPGEKAPATETQIPEGKFQVKTAKAITKIVSTYFQATGSFIAEESSDVAPANGGRVAVTPAEVGDFVKKGQAICILEERDAQLKLDQARAGREQARFFLNQAQSKVGWNGNGRFDPDQVPEVASALAACKSSLASAELAAADARRYASLVKSGGVSQSAYEKYKTQQHTAEAAADSTQKQYEAQVNAARQSFRAIEAAKASLAAAESQVALVEKNLKDTTIRAPFAGYVTSRPISVGQWVSTNSNVATIMQISTLRLRLQVPEKHASEVETDVSVTARVAAYPNHDFLGAVHTIVPAVDSSSRTFIVEARFDNPEAVLHPGMFVNAKLMLPGNEPAVFVPSEAVLYDSTTDANHAFSVNNGTARLNVVLKGDSDGDLVRILTGLKGNETVVIDNQSNLYDGIPVETHP